MALVLLRWAQVFGLCQLGTIAAKGACHMPEREPMTDTNLPIAPPDGAQPMLNVPPVVLAVVGVLAAVHGLIWYMGENWQVWSLYALSFIPVRLGGGSPIPFPQGAQVWSFFTYALLHADAYHLGFNGLWLLIFSTPVARRLGPWRYLLLLALSAAAGALAVLALHWGAFHIVVGASASVSAVLAAAIPIMFAPGFRMGSAAKANYEALQVLTPLQLLRSKRALFFASVFMVMTLITGASMAMTGTAFLEERNIAWEAHLGGFIAGLLLFYLLDIHTVPRRSKI
jgi:membrane associated rhomboid family serine protease